MMLLFHVTMIFYCVVMVIYFTVKQNVEKAGTWFICLMLFYIGYSSAWNYSSFGFVSLQAESIINLIFIK